MNLSPVYYYTCFWCLVVTTDALIPGLVQKALGGIFSKTSASLDIFHPRFLDLRNKYQKKRGGGDCDAKEECDPASPYRTLDGRCNNLAHPGWGRTSDCHIRFLEAAYQGESGLRVSVRGGRPLPLPRDLTLGLFLDRKQPTRDTNFLFTVFGQMVAHDLSDALPQQASGSCCGPLLSGNSSLCVPVRIRPDDPFYSNFNVTCISMVRSAPCRPHCHNNAGKWQQSNTVTSALDGSVIYGSTEDRAFDLRRLNGTGGLKSEMTDQGELLPRPSDEAALPQFCPKNQKKICFYTGDVRTNQHAPLMSIQTVFLREHNRIAGELGKINPHWDDETLYQEARRIVGAELQNIVYAEYLPPLLGPKHMSHYSLYVQPTDDEDWDSSDSDKYEKHRKSGGGTSYDPSVRLGIWNEFTSAVFRLHSMVPAKVGTDHYRFRDLYSCPQLLREGRLDGILSGASEVPSERNDHWFTKDVSHFLLKQEGASFGGDLVAIDIQRGRDHGTPPYSAMLEWLSGGRMRDITKFEHLSPLMSDTSIRLLREHYADVRDVDLFTGVLMEHPMRDSNLGPTACAIVARQFYDIKFGDRFYFEHEGETPSFTPDQRRSLRRSSLSRILCYNTEITTIQGNSLLLESDENPLLPCEEIPKVDLSLWKTSPMR